MVWYGRLVILKNRARQFTCLLSHFYKVIKQHMQNTGQVSSFEDVATYIDLSLDHPLQSSDCDVRNR